MTDVGDLSNLSEIIPRRVVGSRSVLVVKDNFFLFVDGDGAPVHASVQHRTNNFLRRSGGIAVTSSDRIEVTENKGSSNTTTVFMVESRAFGEEAFENLGRILGSSKDNVSDRSKLVDLVGFTDRRIGEEAKLSRKLVGEAVLQKTGSVDDETKRGIDVTSLLAIIFTH